LHSRSDAAEVVPKITPAIPRRDRVFRCCGLAIRLRPGRPVRQTPDCCCGLRGIRVDCALLIKTKQSGFRRNCRVRLHGAPKTSLG
jgi:hypothetical protein